MLLERRSIEELEELLKERLGAHPVTSARLTWNPCSRPGNVRSCACVSGASVPRCPQRDFDQRSRMLDPLNLWTPSQCARRNGTSVTRNPLLNVRQVRSDLEAVALESTPPGQSLKVLRGGTRGSQR